MEEINEIWQDFYENFSKVKALTDYERDIMFAMFCNAYAKYLYEVNKMNNGELVKRFD